MLIHGHFIRLLPIQIIFLYQHLYFFFQFTFYFRKLLMLPLRLRDRGFQIVTNFPVGNHRFLLFRLFQLVLDVRLGLLRTPVLFLVIGPLLFFVLLHALPEAFFFLLLNAFLLLLELREFLLHALPFGFVFGGKFRIRERETGDLHLRV